MFGHMWHQDTLSHEKKKLKHNRLLENTVTSSETPVKTTLD